jgi:methanogenic corrinoid protein MtbC1
METNKLLNRKLLDFKSTLPAVILADHFKLRPDMERSYTDHHRENFQKDVAWILSFLSEAVWAGQPILFEEFISWLKTFLTSINVPMKDVAESLELIKKRINEACTAGENALIDPILSKAVTIIMSDNQKVSIPAMDNHLAPLAQNYLDNLLKGNRNNALSIVLNEVSSGVPVKDIYINVFQPVQYELGRLWQTNRISVAQEHYCTGATQLAMSQLYPFLFKGEKKNRKMVTTCVPGELHEMGARMVTDFFEMEGWDTYYLGANMPINGVISFLIEVKPRFLAISATMTFHVSAMEEMIRSIRSAPGVPAGLKIMVGGYPFKVANGLWKSIGADGYAMNATDAIKLADNLFDV